MKLLVVMPSKYLGNMVIAMQSIAATFEHYRQDDVVLLVDDTFGDLTRLAFGKERNLLIYPRRAVGTSNIVSRAAQYLKFLRALRRTSYDCAVDFDGTVVSARCMRFARARMKIGPGFAKRPGAYSRVIPIDRDAQHCFDDFVAMATAIDVKLEDHNYRLIPKAPDACWNDAALATPLATLMRAGPIACIHPCATKDYKQWDIEKFAMLADWLEDRGWQVVLIGAGTAERERVARMLAAMRNRPHVAHGKLDLVQLVYLFQHARVFIGNDSGPMHLAAASGLHVIALFGPTELLRWQPRSANVRVIKGVEPCSPACRPEACLYDYRCLRSLNVEQVQQALQEID